MSVIKLNVQGMSCGGCSGKVKKALEAVDGVESADVVLETGVVTVNYQESLSANTEQFQNLIEELGFDVVA